MDWNEERIEALTKMWREGLSASQVARQLGGVSRSAVIGKVHRLGIAGREAPARPMGGRPATRIRATAGGVRRVGEARAPREPVISVSRAAFEVAATATIHSLTVHACRWPIGEPDEAGFGFCGRLRSGHPSYCAGHAPMAVRRRETPMKAKEIDRIVSRFAEAQAIDPHAPQFRLREIA
ncbi:MAG TPA: GcrA family cell cycle regulator [Caulobacteraceae bacterium]|nr:GcrA family cell cycle regulator [Caulobacteraceae bacterium]